MPQIIMGPNQTRAVDSSAKKQAYSFLEKLAADDSLPGLHIEPINGSADQRVRTGRVNDFYRAILFKVQGHAAEAHYVYAGFLPHDEAIAFAKTVRLKVNPVNGIAELIADSEPAATTPAPIPATTPAPEPLLAGRRLDETSLVDRLGLDRTLAEAALKALSEDEILALAEHAVQWQGLALLELAGGASLDEIRDNLGIADTTAHPSTDDEGLLTALKHPAALMQFAFIEDNDELRRAIEDNDFGAWRVFLHPEQRRYATTSYNGPFRLSGGAGTGKTVVLLHRARYLSRQNSGARVLLTTFTKTLANAMKADLRRLDPTISLAERLGQPGVHVTGIDAAISAVLRSVDKRDLASDIVAVLGNRSLEIAARTPDTLWIEASRVAQDNLTADLRSRAFLASEYAMVVVPQRIIDRDDYLTARRAGRGTPLGRKQRLAVWKVIEAYRSRASVEGSTDFPEAAAIAANALNRSADCGRLRPLDHVLVDEGQDLHPSHWQFLRALVAPGLNDLFLAEDSHQRIYGQPVVLGRYGIGIVGRSHRLKLNYRTTAQTLRYAVGMLEGVDYVDLENEPETAAAYRSARNGPAPTIIEAPTLTEELNVTADIIRRWLDQGVAAETIGLLVRDAQHAGQLARGLDDRHVAVRVVDTGIPKAGTPVVMTMHRAKGMEFSRVLLFEMDAALMPADYLLKNLSEADRADTLLRERSLLYVAATRARDELVVTFSGRRSAFLPDN